MMDHLIRYTGAIIIGIALLAGAGCHATSPTELYPGFKVQEHSLPPMTILSDVSVLTSVPGDSDVVDVPANKRVGKYCLSYLAQRLSERGDSVEGINLSAVGLMLLQKPFRVITSPDEAALPTNHLEFQKPPFMVDPSFTRDTLALPLLRSLMTSLLTGEVFRKAGTIEFPSARILGEALHAGTIGILMIRVYTVGHAQEFGGQIAPSGSDMTMESLRKTSSISVSFFILKGSTGELLWNDKEQKQGGDPREDRLAGMIDDIIGRMP
jgi:hypothetical protein